MYVAPAFIALGAIALLNPKPGGQLSSVAASDQPSEWEFATE